MQRGRRFQTINLNPPSSPRKKEEETLPTAQSRISFNLEKDLKPVYERSNTNASKKDIKLSLRHLQATSSNEYTMSSRRESHQGQRTLRARKDSDVSYQKNEMSHQFLDQRNSTSTLQSRITDAR